ncbi:AlpA family transcriptional regulator [Geobacter sp. AOG1]|uniref:helix-turn-helix transcriptional regulator n=1 Tax=Geobacter sp. AOG1 TaxID=1566346 RepID=UPI001CC6CC76|nr:helix-turn-helix domain-containing protein [Geobacter sp. AOG1]GFE56399.1 hypothetical protein AOG1_02780 [Geobacter sp. AOG1]
MEKLNLNEVEAAERYGLSVHWFRRARWAGGGPQFIKMGSKVLYPIAETDAFFKSRMRSSTSDPGQAA